MEIGQNYFDLFGLPKDYGVDLGCLAEKYREIQRCVHPDNYADHTETEQRIAVQLASYINEAYETLRSPLKRAIYLLEEAGITTDFDRTTTSDGAFLFQQMELREALSDIEAERNLEGLDDLHDEAKKLLQAVQGEFVSCFSANDMDGARDGVAKLHFITKFVADIRVLEDRLLD